MRNIKKKVMIAGFFATLMLMMPLTAAVGQKDIAGNLGSEQLASGLIQEDLESESMDGGQQPADPGLVKMLYMLGEHELGILFLDLLEQLGLGDELEDEQVVLSEEELSSMVMAAIENIEPGSLGEDIGTIGAVVITGIDGELAIDGGEAGDCEEPLPGPGGFWSWLLQQIFQRIFSSRYEIYESIAEEPRSGWVGGVAEFAVIHQDLLGQIHYGLFPNVTWVEVIEETLAWFDIDFSVYDFIFEDLQTFLVDLVENFNRTWIIQGLGIRQYFWETYIQPIWEDYIKPHLIETTIPNVLQGLYGQLNDKVMWGEGFLTKLKDKFDGFMNSLGDRGREGRRQSYRNFTKLIGTIVRLSVAAVGYLLYMNETQIEEYLQGIYNNVNEYKQAWNDYLNWLSSGPWLTPVNINGTIVEPPSGELEDILVYCQDPENGVRTDDEGYFEGLLFYTEDESPTWWIHKCVTTAFDEVAEEDVTIGDSGEDLADLLAVGAFSEGNLTLSINFSSGGNNNNGYSQQQTQSNIQY
jgi:hypothetical protein